MLKNYKSLFSVYLEYLHFNQVALQPSAFRVSSELEAGRKRAIRGVIFVCLLFFLYNLDAY